MGLETQEVSIPPSILEPVSEVAQQFWARGCYPSSPRDFTVDCFLDVPGGDIQKISTNPKAFV